MSHKSVVFYGDCYQAGGKGLTVDAVYLDFSKAFDKVPHNRLINKIKAHGIGSFVANWIERWLSNIYQLVVLNGHMSDW